MKKTILFLHPDLGIGGAERLVVDAALALGYKDYNIQIVTTHHDVSHCFVETKNGSFPVTVVGDWIPRNIFGKCYALCAYIRMIYAALYILWFSDIDPDVIFCDIVSACIPILKLANIPVVFYCHFPDQLLSSTGSIFKTLYRDPINWIEEKTTGQADAILVNSLFTRNIFHKTFKSIQVTPEVLHPSINTEFFDQECVTTFKDVLGQDFPNDTFIFLSINRFERKKNVSLAIKSLPLVKCKLTAHDWDRVRLIVMGGYDVRVLENVEYFEELKKISIECNMQDRILFLKSPSDLSKQFLLKQCNCLLYTPPNEHFGIVPLEAMYSKKPVIALNSGGPMETVVNNETGYLCEESVEEFSSAMARIIKTDNLAKEMGIAGRKRFDEKFSFQAFGDHLNEVIENLTAVGNKAE